MSNRTQKTLISSLEKGDKPMRLYRFQSGHFFAEEQLNRLRSRCVRRNDDKLFGFQSSKEIRKVIKALLTNCSFEICSRKPVSDARAAKPSNLVMVIIGAELQLARNRTINILDKQRFDRVVLPLDSKGNPYLPVPTKRSLPLPLGNASLNDIFQLGPQAEGFFKAMGKLFCSHPDIYDFVETAAELSAANIPAFLLGKPNRQQRLTRKAQEPRGGKDAYKVLKAAPSNPALPPAHPRASVPAHIHRTTT